MMLDFPPIYPDDGGSIFIWNIATYLPNHITELSRYKYDDIGISTLILYFISLASTMPIPVAMQSNVCDYGHLLAGIVGSNPAGGIDVCLLCECCTLPGRGLYDGLITRPEESYWIWCVWMWSRNLIKEF